MPNRQLTNKINILNTNTNSLDLGENTKITVLSPLEDENFDNLNNYSAMIKIEYGETSFLFTGDCEKLIENKEEKTGKIIEAKRIGIDYAEEAKDYLYRFYYEDNPYVSKK